MAKRIKSARQLIHIDTWEGADALLRKVGQAQNKLSNLEANINAQVDQLKAQLVREGAPLLEQIRLGTDSLQAFAQAHRSDFNGAKSRKLNHGTIGFRMSTRIKTGKDTIDLIKGLFSAKKAREFLVVKESVSKDALAKLTDEQLASVNARRISKDTFFAEPDSAIIADTL